jgi:hypothetical protein
MKTMIAHSFQLDVKETKIKWAKAKNPQNLTVLFGNLPKIKSMFNFWFNNNLQCKMHRKENSQEFLFEWANL